ncbi:MAG TPA: undecaprenyl-diphosphatase UppP [Candidatus Eremiobacteraeota bacterium]|mgnify:CR=1 FL=1|nr:MAG: Undecaprenyl-diphosphatase [bacterium ADurb.Bin363]HPZ10234.1 undecaprenyl-diphosphatase UppP [Candidatus Eremiobacteraeota bacterium]
MTIFQALCLGIIQGLTEFLPISSSAHLFLTRWLFHWPDVDISFDVLLHLGTLLSVIWYFRIKLFKLFIAFISSIRERTLSGNPYKRLSWLFIISCIPAGITGFFLEDFIENYLRSPLLIAFFLILLGCILFCVEKIKKDERKLEDITIIDIMFIAIAQCLALAPGVSRSGITITAGLFRNFSRDDATEISFLMAIPVIAGGALLKVVHLFCHDTPLMGMPLFAGLIASIISGYIAIRFLLGYIQKGTFYPFVLYRVLLGLFIIFIYK